MKVLWISRMCERISGSEHVETTWNLASHWWSLASCKNWWWVLLSNLGWTGTKRRALNSRGVSTAQVAPSEDIWANSSAPQLSRPSWSIKYIKCNDSEDAFESSKTFRLAIHLWELSAVICQVFPFSLVVWQVHWAPCHKQGNFPLSWRCQNAHFTQHESTDRTQTWNWTWLSFASWYTCVND